MKVFFLNVQIYIFSFDYMRLHKNMNVHIFYNPQTVYLSKNKNIEPRFARGKTKTHSHYILIQLGKKKLLSNMPIPI